MMVESVGFPCSFTLSAQQKAVGGLQTGVVEAVSSAVLKLSCAAA